VYGRSRSKRKHTAKARFAEEDLLGVGLASVFLSHLYINANILPRQARDKHRETQKKDVANPTSEVVLPFQISAE
jgi:hypothetical protein